MILGTEDYETIVEAIEYLSDLSSSLSLMYDSERYPDEVCDELDTLETATSTLMNDFQEFLCENM